MRGGCGRKGEKENRQETSVSSSQNPERKRIEISDQAKDGDERRINMVE